MKKLFETNLWCLQTGTPLRKAKEYMKEKRIRHLPILNDENKIISILTQHDFTDIDRFQDLPADLFASSPVKYVTNDTPIKNIALTMIENKISSVLLTDSQTNVLGIITTDDLLFHLSQILDHEKMQDKKPMIDSNFLLTAGEFFKKLSDIGI